MIERIQSSTELDEVKKRQKGYLINQRLDARIDIVHPLPLTTSCARLLTITGHTIKLYAATYQDMRFAVGGRAWSYCPNCEKKENSFHEGG